MVKNPRQEAEYMQRKLRATDLWALLEHGKFALVKGTGGCGKTTLVHQLAEEQNLTLHTIQLNDQLDSKVLFGSYHCTEVPGEFCWKASDFAKFWQEKCIILLEDLDAASPDLIAEVFNLAERHEYALQLGHSLLVDEINLASAERHNAILNVLDGSMPLHRNFRLFACMNPATDAGKQKLPVGVRSKFTEFFVHEPPNRSSCR